MARRHARRPGGHGARGSSTRSLRERVRCSIRTGRRTADRAGAVHVVNDTGDDRDEAVVTVRDERGVRHAWTGTVRADGVVFVGRLDDVGGLVGEVTVSLEHPWIGVVENRYSATTMAHVAR